MPTEQVPQGDIWKPGFGRHTWPPNLGKQTESVVAAFASTPWRPFVSCCHDAAFESGLIVPAVGVGGLVGRINIDPPRPFASE